MAERPRAAASPVRHRGGAAAAAAATVAACAVVASASGGVRLWGERLVLTESAPALLRLAGLAAVAGGVAGLVVQRQAVLTRDPSTEDVAPRAMRSAATIMGALLLVTLMVHPLERDGGPGRILTFGVTIDTTEVQRERSAEAVTRRSQGPGVARRGSGRSQTPVSGGEAPTAGAAAAPEALGGTPPAGSRLRFLALLAILVTAYILTRPRHMSGHEEESAFEMELDPAQAVRSLEASLLELDTGDGNPREQVTAAYLRLLSALAAAGAARRSFEAPHEHLRRVLGPLGVGPAPLHRLGDLYVEAQFGARPVGPRHRAEAGRALRTSLADLKRAVDAASVSERV